MRKRILFLSLAFSILLGSNMKAQTYSDTNEAGEKVYYKIVSAAEGFENKCIEDNLRNSKFSNYSYMVNDMDSENQYQQWQLFPDADNEESYYIKNRKSLRFIKQSGNWVGNYWNLTYGTTKKAAGFYEFVPLGEEQILIKYTTTDGDVRYLNAVDSAQASAEKFVLAKAKNSSYAWKITDENGLPVGIRDVIGKEPVRVAVANRKIVVYGTDDYDVFDLQGRKVRKERALLPGTFIVTTKNKNYKVLVK